MLPPTSYITLEIKKLARPSLIWSRQDVELSSHEIIDKFAYCSALEGETSETYTHDTKIAKIDRYGGAGIGVNGGGVRNGSFEGISAKGIGKSDLAGLDAPYWHSYGGASMKEAIREAVWGELYNSALPFGAVRVDAIIATGTTVPLRYADSNGYHSSARALIIRQPFVRPAHYMRASHFRPSKTFSDTYVSDSIRTRNAIVTLETGLKNALKVESVSDLGTLLTISFRRYAGQAAVARAKRLIHGSISPSNISLDGRLLDFGMSSAVSGFGKIIIARGCPDASQQHHGIINAARDLTYYINKYLPRNSTPPRDLFSMLEHECITEYDRTFTFEILKLTGFPESALATLNKKQLIYFSAPLQEIINSGNSEPFKLLCPCENYVPSMPVKMGNYDVSEILITIAEASDAQDANRELSTAIPNDNLRAWLIDSYLELFVLIQNITSADFHHLRMFVSLNARRVNSRLDSLYSFNLNKTIDAALNNGASINKTINEIIGREKLKLSDLENDTINFGESGSSIISSPALGIISSGQRVSKENYSNFIKTLKCGTFNNEY